MTARGVLFSSETMSGTRNASLCCGTTSKLDDSCISAADYFSPFLGFFSSGAKCLWSAASALIAVILFSHQTWTKTYKRAAHVPPDSSEQSHQTNPTKHTEKTTTVTTFTLHSLQCYSTNPSFLSSLPLPWPLSSPVPQLHRSLALALAVPVSPRAPIKAPARIKAPTRIKSPTRVKVPVKSRLATQASTRCAVKPLSHSPICRIASGLRSKTLTRI